MIRGILVRGMIAGLIAAVFAFGFASIIGEPQIEQAITFEQLSGGHAHGTQVAAGADPEDEVVTRTMQSTIGLATGLAMLAVAYGGIFAIVYALALGRVGSLGERGTALLVSMALFVALFAVPFLKYPATPPAVGDPETITRRTLLYVSMMLVGAVATTGALLMRRRLVRTEGAWNAALLAGAAFIAVVAAAYLLLPPVNEIGAFPADTLWRFRVASFGMQLVLWSAIGLSFGILSERAHHRLRQRDGGREAPAGALL